MRRSALHQLKIEALDVIEDHIMYHSYELSLLSLIQTGDAERRGAHADLPERHVPQQARVQRQNRPGRRQRHGDPLYVCRQCRRQARVRGERVRLLRGGKKLHNLLASK